MTATDPFNTTAQLPRTYNHGDVRQRDEGPCPCGCGQAVIVGVRRTKKYATKECAKRADDRRRHFNKLNAARLQRTRARDAKQREETRANEDLLKAEIAKLEAVMRRCKTLELLRPLHRERESLLRRLEMVESGFTFHRKPCGGLGNGSVTVPARPIVAWVDHLYERSPDLTKAGICEGLGFIERRVSDWRVRPDANASMALVEEALLRSDTNWWEVFTPCEHQSCKAGIGPRCDWQLAHELIRAFFACTCRTDRRDPGCSAHGEGAHLGLAA